MSKPQVIIRTLEDIPEWLDQRLLAAYLETVYRVVGPDKKGASLKIGDEKNALIDHLVRMEIDSLAIITAFNPHSVLLSPLENERRNLALREDLKGRATLLLPSIHIAPDESWEQEHGFCAAGIESVLAVEIGRNYEQNAIVCWQKGGFVELWWL